MLGKLICTTLVFAASMTGGIAIAQSQVNLSASEIVSKNVAARGGLQAWRAVQSMSWKGKMGAGGNQRAPLPVSAPSKSGAKIPTDPRPKDEVQLPFLMEMERPRKVRFELQFKGQTAVQVYDGANGWKLRPYLNHLEVEPFTPDESHIASLQFELDGPLVDYAAKGTAIELAGKEKVDDQDTYKLKLTMKDGHSIHVWIDAKTFLEAKIEGAPRRLDGIEHPVEIYYRDYRQVNGLQIPFVLETKVLPVGKPSTREQATQVPVERIAIEGVEVNPKLEASLFSKPEIQTAQNHR
jgi:hypothetical protein